MPHTTSRAPRGRRETWSAMVPGPYKTAYIDTLLSKDHRQILLRRLGELAEPIPCLPRHPGGMHSSALPPFSEPPPSDERWVEARRYAYTSL